MDVKMNKTVGFFWISSGILILLWTVFWFIKKSNEPGIVGNVLKLQIGYYLLGLYILVAGVYFLNRFLYKKEAKKIIKKNKYE
jgi:EamA domain-containing membrane protein RarD